MRFTRWLVRKATHHIGQAGLDQTCLWASESNLIHLYEFDDKVKSVNQLASYYFCPQLQLYHKRGLLQAEIYAVALQPEVRLGRRTAHRNYSRKRVRRFSPQRMG